jgi:hypothetical protein
MRIFIKNSGGSYHPYTKPRWSTILPSVGLACYLLVGGCWKATNNWQYSEGDKVGVINKVSQKGVIDKWKTYEAQMAAEGLVSTGDSMGANLFDFAIDNYLPKDKQEEMANKLRDAMNSGQKVKIHYIQMLNTFPSRSGSNHLIQDIQPVNLGGVENIVQDVSTGSNIVKKTESGVSVYLDNHQYNLRHDASGKLKITEEKEIQ